MGLLFGVAGLKELKPAMTIMVRSLEVARLHRPRKRNPRNAVLAKTTAVNERVKRKRNQEVESLPDVHQFSLSSKIDRNKSYPGVRPDIGTTSTMIDQKSPRFARL